METEGNFLNTENSMIHSQHSNELNDIPLNNSSVHRDGIADTSASFGRIYTDTSIIYSKKTTNKKIELTASMKSKEGLLSMIFFLNANKLFKITQKRRLNRRDLIPLPEAVKGRKALSSFLEIYYTDAKKTSNIPLWLAIYKFQKKRFILATVFKIISDFIMISLPLAFRQINSNMKKQSIPIPNSLLMIALIPTLLLMQDLLRQHSEKLMAQTKAMVGQALRSFLFEKLMNTDYIFLSTAEPNFLSRLIFFEIENLLDFIAIVPSLISGPVALAFLGGLVIYQLGMLNIYMITASVLLMVALVLYLLNFFNLKVSRGRDKYSTTQSKQALKLQELIANIDQVKVNLFEGYFRKRLIGLRRDADRHLQWIHRSYGYIEFILQVIPFLFSCVIVIAYKAIIGQEVTSSQTFTIISMMIAVTVPLRQFSDSLRRMRLYQIAYTCISKFFKIVKEKQVDNCLLHTDGLEVGEIAMTGCFFLAETGAVIKEINDTFENASLGIPQTRHKNRQFSIVRSKRRRTTLIRVESEKPAENRTSTQQRIALKNITFSVSKGEKICVLGAEGSGKFVFFLALLGELTLESGHFGKKGKVVFLDMDNQKFLKSTIRENIILGMEYFADKFNNICEVVGLNLDKYIGRDLTEIIEGQRNISFTDNKKILLARMLYQDPDIILINKFFDQLSKDQQTDVFEKIVRGYLKEKTVFYTSNINLLIKQSDRIMVFKDGELIEKDVYSVLISRRRSEMYALVMTDSSGSSNFFGKILEGVRIYPKETAIEHNNKKPELGVVRIINDESSEISSILSINQEEKLNNVLMDWMGKTIDRIRGKTLREEEEFVLNNSKESMKRMFLVNGKFNLILIIVIFIIADSSLIMIQLWMALWGANVFNLSYEANFYYYIAIFAFASVSVITRELFFTTILLGNLTGIYKQCVEHLLSAEKQWFDQNPSNRIVYLLTKDQTIIDNDLVRSFFIVFDTSLITAIIVLSLNYFYFGIMLLVTIALGFLAYSINSNFDVVSQRLLAFTTKSRAEMIDTYLENFDNLSMLRAFGKSDYYITKFYDRTNAFQLAYTNLYNHSMRWLNMRITVFSMLLLISITLLPLLLRATWLSQYYINASWQLSYCLGTAPFLLASIVNFSRFYPTTTLHLLSAQRIFRYIFDLTRSPEKNSLNMNSPRKRGRKDGKERWKQAGKIIRNSHNPINTEAPLEGKILEAWGEGGKKNKNSEMFRKVDNVYMVKTAPLIYMKNVSLSSPNMKILKNIHLKVYQAEKVAFVDPHNSGRQSLLNLILLLERMDDNDESVFKINLENVDIANPVTLRKDMSYLSQYPTMFSGTVKENIDPQNEFDEEEIIRTLHFLKIFEAIEKYTGFTKEKDIILSLRQKEGKIDFKVENEEDIKKRRKNAQRWNPNQQAETPVPLITKRYTRKRSIAINQIADVVKNNPIESSFEQSSDSSQQKKAPVDQFNYNDSIDNEKNIGSTEDNYGVNRDEIIYQFFQQQIDNELPISERAKRIDSRLQQFDNQYDVNNLLANPVAT